MMTMRDDLMVQQQVSTVWQHMVGVICLNQTNRRQVKAVLPKFFERFPTSESVLRGRIIDMEEILAPLGMRHVRAKRIYRMSIDYQNWNGEDATKLYGIGKYGSDSYELFYKNRIPDNVGDHELKRYIEEDFKGT
jgi:methyl-CpG-binding domain protein 4